VSFPKGTTEHPINKSGKKEILVSVWDFGAVHPQSERSHYFCNDHPAKMRPPLARAILQIYGESPVLDPMAGIGTTLVEATLLGMDAVGIEFEKKFVDQANKNIEHIRRTNPAQKLGKAICIKGDARNLSCLNNQKVSSVIFSPPYFNAIESISTGHQGPEGGHLKRQHKLAKLGKSGYGNKSNIGHTEKYGSIIFSPPYFNALKKGDEGPHATSGRISYQERIRRFQGYSKSEGNIGNIPQFGSIIFSPPYCGVMDAKRHVGGIASRDASLAKTALYSTDESNLGNVRSYGVFGSIIFSPPYADAIRGNKEGPMATSTPSGWRSKKVRINEGYSRDLGNIGNISQFGSIIFSPPFGEANRGSGIAKKGYEGKHGKDEKLKDRCDRPLSQDKNNISNSLYGRTYLSEMFKVYSECYRVLKPSKFMVVVVKDIRRKGLTIPLGCDTVKLLELAGFEIFDIIINKMYFPSFWQLTHAQKTQAKGIPMTLRTHEYVIIARKPNAKGNPSCDFKCYKCRYNGFCAIQRWVYEQESKRKNSNNKYKLNVLPALDNYRIFSPLFDKHRKKRFFRYHKRSKYEDN